MNIKVFGDKWEVRYLTEEEFDATHPGFEDSAGITVRDKKQIHINQDNLTFITVLHEIVHAYSSQTFLNQVDDLTFEQFDEVYAELFAANGEKMIRQAKKIIKHFRKEPDGK